MPTKRSQFFQSLRAQWLGMQMRELRDQGQLTLKDAAAYLEVEFSSLARYERAEWPFKEHQVRLLLDVYGVTREPERNEYIELARNSWRVNRWEADTDAGDHKLPFAPYSWVQRRAEEICAYGAATIPPLLQTEQYADAFIRVTNPGLARYKIANLIRKQKEHQEILAEKAVQVSAVIEETALRRPVGGGDVLRTQLDHLSDLTQQHNVEIHLLSESLGAHPALHGPFTLLRMQWDYPTVAYLEHLGGSLWLERDRAERYAKAYQELRSKAMSATLSKIRIGELLKGDV